MSSWFKKFLFILVVYKLAIFFWLPLVDDETYHWGWTQKLELSYFDHPAMIAWVEYVSTAIFGDNKFGIRFPALLFFIGTSILMYKTIRQAFDQKIAEVSLLIFSTAPLWGLSSFVAAPELPFVFFWWLAIYIFWQGVRWQGSQLSPAKTWILLGFTFGCGINSKFPIFLLALGMGIYLLFDSKNRRQLLTPWPWLGLVIAAIMAIPIFVWNAEHGWPSFLFQFQRRHQGGGGLDLNRYAQFIGYQTIFMSPGYYLALILGGILALKKWYQQRFRFFFLLALPTFMVFYYQPLFAEFKPHWSGSAKMTAIVFVAALWYQGLSLGSWSIFKAKSRLWLAFTAFFLILINAITWGPIFNPKLVPAVFSMFNSPEKYKPHFDFSNELFGWEEAGKKAIELKEKLVGEGFDVVLSAKRYETVAQLTYASRQTVWQLSREVDQYWFWQTEDMRKQLFGKNFLFVANDKYNDDPMQLGFFDRCELEELKIYRGEIHSRTFKFYHCHNFHGLK